MAPSRRLSNGRSPLVNQQRQITSFFTPNKASPSTTTTTTTTTSSSNPNPTPPSISSAPPKLNPRPSSATPSSQSKKPLLVIGPSKPSPINPSSVTPSSDSKAKTPESVKKLYGSDVVGKKVRVYWPLDNSWYDGCVKSFDEKSGKHLVQYDDAEEEMLELEKEKIEWVEEEVRSFRRLKRRSFVVEEEEEDESKEKKKFGRLQRNLASEKDVFGEDDAEEEKVEEEDDSEDEDWGKNVAKEVVDNDSDDMELEDEEEDEVVGSSKRGKNSESRKRRNAGGEKLGSGKKSKIGGSVEKIAVRNFQVGSGSKAVESLLVAERGQPTNLNSNSLMGDVAEQFATREAKKLPFLGAERRDAKRRRPGDVNYDPRTLYLPPDFLKSLSGGQRQWWDFKSKHMDKVLFFKMGKFYELFEMDAHVGAKELDLQYMKGEQPHVGFPEKNFTVNVEKLASKGYRVLVIEQTETPDQLDIRRKEQGSKDKVVKREICAVVTKGTLTEGEMLVTNPDTSYLMSLTESQVSDDQKGNLVLGVCLVDVSTSRFMLGQFTDDSERNSLCSLLSEVRPAEIIKPAKVLSPETEKVLLRHTRNPLVNELVPLAEFWNADKTIEEVRSMQGRLKNSSVSGPLITTSLSAPDLNNTEHGPICLPAVLSQLVSAGENGSSALSAFGGCLFYLRQAFLDETLLRFANFELLPCSGFRDIPQKPYMVLHSAAIENLEIFENNRNGGSSGTLFTQLNHCVTAFGKRLLKNWLARPLYHPWAIRERQDAIAGLKGDNLPSVLEFRKDLSRLPDTERLLARLFASSEANGRYANKVVLYEDAAKKQLQEFITALRGCELLAGALSSLSAVSNSVDSVLLRRLLTPGEGLPDVYSIISHFKDAFDWTEADRSGRIIPREGVDTEYDSACKIVSDIKSNLTKHLKEQRKIIGDASIDYVTVGKDLYLLEVPESLQRSVPRDYELRSSKKGFRRYWSPQIKKLLGELSQAEAEKESKLKSILQRLISDFCMHHIKWRQFISTTAELDVLISLAIASDYYEGPSCRPTILNSTSSSVVPCLLAKCLGHPFLRSEALGRGTFVPNDITIGGSGNPSFVLLTGPNMGGKSTLLRQVCMAVILAQIGADVPAESFEISPVDQIFVRMGARDHIMAGQSTFLTELSETASMLFSATRNSLVILDELGRGTSTSDGQAIAESVLEHFVHKVNCRGMFSTHYHLLAIDYQNDPQVSLCHMACQVEKGDKDVEEVTFLYRLTPGACPKSYGVNVARLAGLPNSVLQRAAAKSREFEVMYGKNRQGSKGLADRCWDEKLSSLLQDLSRVIANPSYLEPHERNDVALLPDIHQRARLLLQGS